MRSEPRSPWSPARLTSLALLLTGGFGLLHWSAAPTSAPGHQLRRSIDRVVRILEDPTLRGEPRGAARRAAVRREADAILDFQEMARRALGAHWQDLSETDRRRLTVRLADLVERTYAPMIEAFRGEHIVHAGDVVDRDRAMVTMRVVSARGSEMPVDFLMRRREDRWRVYDVSIRGVSLVESYRAEFDRIVKAASRDALVAADWHGHHPGPASDPPRAVAAPGPAGPATMPPVRRRIAPSRERVTAEALQLAIARRERRGRPGQQRLVAPPVPVPPEGPHERIDALLQEPADVAAPGQRPCQGVRVESQHAEKAVPPAQELGGGRG